MSESMKFGPEWLRNSLGTSPTKQEEINCRPILSDYRYSREDFLGLLDERNSKKMPEYIVDGLRKLHIEHFQPPMVLIPSDDEKPAPIIGHSRTFVNSNIKHGFPNNNNWRKNTKEPELENWRSTDYKEKHHYNPTSSRNGEKSKPNWRDKGNYDDQTLGFSYSPTKNYKPPEKREISPIKQQNTQKRAETVEEKQNQYVQNIVSDTATKSLFENSSNTKETEGNENSKMQPHSSKNSCELNFKKLENDIMQGLQELNVDEEVIEPAKPQPQQKPKELISWLYIDPIGKIQGPFTEDDMTTWYTHGFFYDGLMLRRSIDSNFISLNHLIQAFGAAQPFAIASTGFPIPKIDHVEALVYKQPQKVPVVNPQSQFDAAMFRGQNIVQQFSTPEPVQLQNNIQQFQPSNLPPNYQYLQNRPPQPNIPQVDPRLMSNVNPYIQAYNSLNNPNRIQQQMMPQMMNPIPQQMKTPYQAPVLNQIQQSIIQQMPSILPTNPIQKLLFELQKQKELEQQRAMYIQHSQNIAIQSMNEQIMQQQQQQQNKIEIGRQSKIQQVYYNNLPNKYENNGNGSLNRSFTAGSSSLLAEDGNSATGNGHAATSNCNLANSPTLNVNSANFVNSATLNGDLAAYYSNSAISNGSSALNYVDSASSYGNSATSNDNSANNGNSALNYVDSASSYGNSATSNDNSANGNSAHNYVDSASSYGNSATSNDNLVNNGNSAHNYVDSASSYGNSATSNDNSIINGNSAHNYVDSASSYGNSATSNDNLVKNGNSVLNYVDSAAININLAPLNNLQAVNSNNEVVPQNNSNIYQNQVIQPSQDPGNFDADDEGEFRIVGNIKRKKFQKENKEKPEKFKENGSQSSRSVTKLPEGKITVIKNDLKPLNTDVKTVKSNNDISQIIINQLNKVEEKSKLPAMPAPWIDKVTVNPTEIENLKRIQIEEEEVRQIEMEMKRERELEKAKKEQEMKQKVNQLSWNIVVTEKSDVNAEESSVWEVPVKNSTVVKNSTRQSLPTVKSKPLDSASSSHSSNNTKEVENEFKNWCMDMLSKMNTSIDIPVFVAFLIDLESPYEIEDYVKMYLGDTIESHLFTKKFLERRSLYRKATKKIVMDDDLCAPPKAINPGTHHEEPFRNQNKKKLDKKTRKGMKVDANILGFKATADPNRIVGELHEDEY